ncbi:uncharacterized protein LOC116296656 [Actinia tenebrosa]|uniref:Uncharacterized protein LOC116296656 n=1 Tax=Actinia tenebrosa TaxID=6105 RepID=A0A6P8I6C6_ACTTE|nr:uncharacterized protein LOC116296656 [Actinia tenebrosa]
MRKTYWRFSYLWRKNMAFMIDNLSSEWQAVDATIDPTSEGYKEFLICHRCPVDDNKKDFKYSASIISDDSKPAELLLHGAKGRDPLHGIQRPLLKVKDNEIIGMDVCGERCEKKQ